MHCIVPGDGCGSNTESPFHWHEKIDWKGEIDWKYHHQLTIAVFRRSYLVSKWENKNNGSGPARRNRLKSLGPGSVLILD